MKSTTAGLHSDMGNLELELGKCNRDEANRAANSESWLLTQDPSGVAIAQLTQAVAENASLQVRALGAIAARVQGLERRKQQPDAVAGARPGNGARLIPKELIENIALLGRVSDALASRVLGLENLVRETNELVKRFGEGTPAGGRFAVYQGHNTALTRILNRFKMYVDTTDLSLAPHLMMEGHWEPWITELFTESVRPGMTVVDIGANFGYFTILAGTGVGPTGKVYAFEADPRNFEILRLNLEVNGLLQIVEAHQCAVLDTEGAIGTPQEPHPPRMPQLVRRRERFYAERLSGDCAARRRDSRHRGCNEDRRRGQRAIYLRRYAQHSRSQPKRDDFHGVQCSGAEAGRRRAIGFPADHFGSRISSFDPCARR